MRAALDLIKRELGPEAVILGTRTVPAAGLGRLVGRNEVEITAAPADAPARGPRLKADGRQPRERQPDNPPGAPSKSRTGLPPATSTRDPAATSNRPMRPPTLPEHVYPYFVRLVQSEVAEELAARILRSAADSIQPGTQVNERAVADALRRCIAEMIPTAGPPGSPVAQRLALVGPPGGGKTTTLAKLAAHFKLRLGTSVALLSLDTQRLAASEQLRRYGELLRVPVEIAQTVEGVRDALRRLKEANALLIDTPGVGPREQGHFARLAALLRACRPDEVHLVLPASLAPTAQNRLAKEFAALRPSHVVLTHLDEVVGLGVVLNVVNQLGCRLSYLANGQNVPRDLEEACSRRLSELILPV